ncbi:mitochondrial carrier domain-containing protein [Fomitopsis serialis]|uniref:mitochondrial carrier domain-containing protein n=1 Tax=Fomitopsis serialis TaxID=139415 RepID=UPI0020082398|nr:mitochondrial carrier domain-containing protein [Neoantrodia serialis]KAH9933921.1 mitochondrial carrier domain-containing protein [Neoantrodia serialis]
MPSKLFEHPFDLTKARLRSQVLDATARFDGPMKCLVQTWQKEGLRGLYRVSLLFLEAKDSLRVFLQGLRAPIVGAMAENATLFWTYTELTQSSKTCLEAPGVSPAQAAAALSSVAPAAALPTGLYSSPFHKLPGPISVLTSVVRTTGFRGLWLGQTATLIRETGGGAAWLASEEAVATFLLTRRHIPSKDKKELRPWKSAVSGAAAGIAYNVALFPADTVKSTVQTEAELRPRAPGEPGPTFLSAFRAMYAAQGIKGLYAGCGITAAGAISSSAPKGYGS